MNWYKIAQNIYPAYIPDSKDFEYLTGKPPNESGSKPGKAYQPGKSYQGAERRLPYNVPGEMDPYALYVMDLKSEISSIEESIESYKEELKNPMHSTRSKKLPFDIVRERKINKWILQNQIRKLKSLKAKLIRETKKTTKVYPDEFRGFLNQHGNFRNP